MNQEEKTLDECCSFEHKWKISRGNISKSIRPDEAEILTTRINDHDNIMCKV